MLPGPPLENPEEGFGPLGASARTDSRPSGCLSEPAIWARLGRPASGQVMTKRLGSGQKYRCPSALPPPGNGPRKAVSTLVPPRDS